MSTLNQDFLLSLRGTLLDGCVKYTEQECLHLSYSHYEPLNDSHPVVQEIQQLLAGLGFELVHHKFFVYTLAGTVKLKLPNIDWTSFDKYAESSIVCRCGGIFRSHAKMKSGVTSMVLWTRKPCPSCGRHDSSISVKSDPEIMTF